MGELSCAGWEKLCRSQRPCSGSWTTVCVHGIFGMVWCETMFFTAFSFQSLVSCAYDDELLQRPQCFPKSFGWIDWFPCEVQVVLHPCGETYLSRNISGDHINVKDNHEKMGTSMKTLEQKTASKKHHQHHRTLWESPWQFRKTSEHYRNIIKITSKSMNI